MDDVNGELSDQRTIIGQKSIGGKRYKLKHQLESVNLLSHPCSFSVYSMNEKFDAECHLLVNSKPAIACMITLWPMI
jgi:hypothetical protein